MTETTDGTEKKTETVETKPSSDELVVQERIAEIEGIIADLKPRLTGELDAYNRETVARGMQHIRRAAAAAKKVLE